MFKSAPIRLIGVGLANLHWVITAGLALALVPAFRVAKLPFRVDWYGFLIDYWVGMTARAVFFAIILYTAGFPRKTIGVFWKRCCKQKPRLLLLALFAAFMLTIFRWNVGIILTVDVIGVLELHEQGKLARMRHSTAIILKSGAYLFVGLVLMMSYSDVIASLKYAGTHSEAVNHLDTILFGGMTVRHLASTASQWIPHWGYAFLGIVYLGMLSEVGAGLLIICFSEKKRAFQMVGSLLIAFYIALAIFYVWPTMGPFSLGSSSHAQAKSSIQLLQSALVHKARAFFVHQNAPEVSTDYYIGFPCMHIAIPLIVLWFLRQQRRVAALLIAYDALLVAAIILLQWHFFSDLIGGVLVAGLSIFLTEQSNRGPHVRAKQPKGAEIPVEEVVNV